MIPRDKAKDCEIHLKLVEQKKITTKLNILCTFERDRGKGSPKAFISIVVDAPNSDYYNYLVEIPEALSFVWTSYMLTKVVDGKEIKYLDAESYEDAKLMFEEIEQMVRAEKAKLEATYHRQQDRQDREPCLKIVRVVHDNGRVTYNEEI